MNRHPMNFPDWTHSNSVVYSRDDGNFLISSRHQHWVMKIDYRDGTGSGNVIWKLGSQGDFTLVGGVDPTDWFYGQHDPVFFSPNSTGIFTLGIMDNGNYRAFPNGSVCGSPGAPVCYSTVPVFRIDESAKTATLVSHQKLPPELFSTFAGSSRLLANGNIEFDLCGLQGVPTSQVMEVTPGNAPQTVWQLDTTTPGINLYRSFRIPSLYPGVQW